MVFNSSDYLANVRIEQVYVGGISYVDTDEKRRPL